MSTLKVTNLQHPDAAAPSITFSTDGTVSQSVVVNAQTGTTYSLVAGDSGKLVTLTNAAAITVTVPANSSVDFPVGTAIALVQYGAGQVTITGASGVTLNSTAGADTDVPISAQFGGVQLYQVAVDEWLVIGSI